MENIDTQGNLIKLIGGIFEDTKVLLKQELALAKCEVRDESTKLLKSFAYTSIGFILGCTTLFLFGFALANFITEHWTDISQWQSFLISGFIFAIFTVLFIMKGIKVGKRYNIIPEKSLASFQNDIKLVKESV